MAYLYELASINDKAHDRHVDAQTFVDFSARYSLTKNLQVSFEAQNLTDESYFVYAASPWRPTGSLWRKAATSGSSGATATGLACQSSLAW